MQFIQYAKSKGAAFPLAIARIMLGFILLWGALDKIFGLMMTPAGSGMIDGGSPTHDFLMYHSGMFQDFFGFLAGYSEIVDVVIVAGLFLIGTALILGIGMKLTLILGSVMLFIFYLASLPLKENPIIDFRLIYIAVLFAIYMAKAGDCIGLGERWRNTTLVKRFPILE